MYLTSRVTISHLRAGREAGEPTGGGPTLGRGEWLVKEGEDMRRGPRAGDEYETVWTLWYYCDGPREGVADYQGRPHVFVSEWDEQADDYGDAFLLKPIDDETFRLVMEDWAIWQRSAAPAFQGEAG